MSRVCVFHYNLLLMLFPGETESAAGQTAGINEGASTSRMNTATASSSNATPTPPLQLTADSSSPAVSSRRHPVLSSTPNTIFAGRPKGQLEPRPLPLLATSTPTTGTVPYSTLKGLMVYCLLLANLGLLLWLYFVFWLSPPHLTFLGRLI